MMMTDLTGLWEKNAAKRAVDLSTQLVALRTTEGV
jgi:hypothetical protein